MIWVSLLRDSSRPAAVQTLTLSGAGRWTSVRVVGWEGGMEGTSLVICGPEERWA